MACLDQQLNDRQHDPGGLGTARTVFARICMMDTPLPEDPTRDCCVHCAYVSCELLQVTLLLQDS